MDSTYKSQYHRMKSLFKPIGNQHPNGNNNNNKNIVSNDSTFNDGHMVQFQIEIKSLLSAKIIYDWMWMSHVFDSFILGILFPIALIC